MITYRWSRMARGFEVRLGRGCHAMHRCGIGDYGNPPFVWRTQEETFGQPFRHVSSRIDRTDAGENRRGDLRSAVSAGSGDPRRTDRQRCWRRAGSRALAPQSVAVGSGLNEIASWPLVFRRWCLAVYCRRISGHRRRSQAARLHHRIHLRLSDVRRLSVLLRLIDCGPVALSRVESFPDRGPHRVAAPLADRVSDQPGRAAFFGCRSGWR